MLKKYEKTIEAGLVAGVITFILTYATLLIWRRDGFDLLEVSFMTLLPGFYLFITVIFVHIIMLNKYMRTMYESGLIPIKKIYQVVLTLLIGFLVFILMDAIIFWIDNSIPVEFAEALQQMAIRNGDVIEGVEEFARLPFGIQNGIFTFIMGLIAAFISLLFIRKDGRLFKWE